MHEAVEDGVSDGGISDDLVPEVDGNLAGDDGRAPLIAVLDDLEEIAALFVVELFGPQSSRMRRSMRANVFSILA